MTLIMTENEMLDRIADLTAANGEIKTQLSEMYDLLALAEQRNKQLETEVRASQAWAKSNLSALDLAIADLTRVIDMLRKQANP